MDYIYKRWSALIDITTVCPHSCVYCTRYERHLRPDQRRHMPLEQIEAAILAYKDWPTEVSIIGGEPLLHPQFDEINALLRKHLPQEKLNIFTSGLPSTPKTVSTTPLDPNSLYNWKPEYPWTQWPETNSDMTRTYRTIRFNPHNEEQMTSCSHHPLTIAVEEAVPDKALMWKLINNCWLQRCWSPTVNIHGAYFCEVGAALDMLLFDGANAWPVEAGGWKRKPHEFQEQVSQLCPRCGMCLPGERQLLGHRGELFSPGLLGDFRKRKLIRLNDQVSVVDQQYDVDTIERYAKTWYPGNYREDIVEDEDLPSFFKGFNVPLRLKDNDESLFCVDTDAEYAEALKRVVTLPIVEGPHLAPKRRYFLYQGLPFDALYDQYPFVLPERRHERHLYYRGLMLYLRCLLDDEAFAQLPGEDCSFEELAALPDKIHTLFNTVLLGEVEKRAKALAGREVYFWGCGAAWRQYRQFFSNVNARCFLVDVGSAPAKVDGLEIRNPEHMAEEFAKDGNLPIVVFARRLHMPGIEQALIRYGLKQREIIWAPLEA